jgi:hypothetical protein
VGGKDREPPVTSLITVLEGPEQEDYEEEMQSKAAHKTRVYNTAD